MYENKTVRKIYGHKREEVSSMGYRRLHYETLLFFYGACSPIVGHGLLILEVFFEITNNDTPRSVGLLWTNDQPVAETST